MRSFDPGGPSSHNGIASGSAAQVREAVTHSRLQHKTERRSFIAGPDRAGAGAEVEVAVAARRFYINAETAETLPDSADGFDCSSSSVSNSDVIREAASAVGVLRAVFALTWPLQIAEKGAGNRLAVAAANGVGGHQ